MFGKMHRLVNILFWLKPFFRCQQQRYGEVLKPDVLWAPVLKLFAAVALLNGMLDRKKITDYAVVPIVCYAKGFPN